MKNAKVELSKKSGYYEVTINGVTVLVGRIEYNEIEKTL